MEVLPFTGKQHGGSPLSSETARFRDECDVDIETLILAQRLRIAARRA